MKRLLTIALSTVGAITAGFVVFTFALALSAMR